MHIPDSGIRAMTDLAASERLPSWPLGLTRPRHTAKHHSRGFRRATDTIKKWLAEGVPLEQRLQYARVLYAELDRIEADAARVRAFADWCRQGGADEMACTQNRGALHALGATPGGLRDGRQGR